MALTLAAVEANGNENGKGFKNNNNNGGFNKNNTITTSSAVSAVSLSSAVTTSAAEETGGLKKLPGFFATTLGSGGRELPSLSEPSAATVTAAGAAGAFETLGAGSVSPPPTAGTRNPFLTRCYRSPLQRPLVLPSEASSP
jgi:hypothetical protein